MYLYSDDVNYRMSDKRIGGDLLMGCGCSNSGVSSANIGFHRPRSFLTKEEKVELLKEYKNELEKEVKGVSERLKELEAV